MNEDFILEMIQPKLNDCQELTYEEFDQLFSALRNAEKYKIVDFLIKYGIELVDTKTRVASDESSKDISPIPSQRDFSEPNTQPLPDLRNINISNEQLCLLYQAGDKQAGNMLLFRNKRLVQKEAFKYHRWYKHKLDFEDLEQSGYIGMLKAAAKFDISMDTRFSTYATWWIDQYILRTIADEGFTIRVPVHMFEAVNMLNRIERENHCTNREELIHKAIEQTSFSLEKINEILWVRDRILAPTSLNKFVGEDEDTELMDLVPDEGEAFDERVVNGLIYKEVCAIARNVLTIRQWTVLEKRLGILNGNPQTLEQIGNHFGLTRERIRQIEAKALHRLRANKHIRKNILEKTY